MRINLVKAIARAWPLVMVALSQVWGRTARPASTEIGCYVIHGYTSQNDGVVKLDCVPKSGYPEPVEITCASRLPLRNGPDTVDIDLRDSNRDPRVMYVREGIKVDKKNPQDLTIVSMKDNSVLYSKQEQATKVKAKADSRFFPQVICGPIAVVSITALPQGSKLDL